MIRGSGVHTDPHMDAAGDQADDTMLRPAPTIGSAPPAGLFGLRLGLAGVERFAFAAGVAAVGFLAVAACLPGARRFALWQDEVASARVLAEPHPLAVTRHVVRTESTPPLWYWLAWAAHHCGLSAVDVRLLSVVAAALLAAGTAVAARRVVARPIALLAGAAVALAWQVDFHGRELRAYELVAVLAVALAAAAQAQRPVLLAAVVAAGSLTHYFFLFSVAAVLVWKPRLWRPVAVGLVPCVLWAPFLLRQYEHHRFSFIGPFDVRTVANTYWSLFARAQPQTPALHELAPLALLAAVAAGAVVLWRRSESGRLWALLAVLPVGASALLWLAGSPIYDVRNLIVTAPFAAVAVSALVGRLPRRAALAAAAAALVLVGGGFVRSNRVAPVPYDRIAAALVAEGWRAPAPIAVYGNVYALWGPLEWYLPGQPVLVLAAAERVRPSFVIVPGGARSAAVVRHAAAVRVVRQTLVARIDGAAPPRGSAVLVEQSR